MRIRAHSVALLVAVGLWLCAAVALADALVVVRVQGDGAPEGRVTLTARSGGTAYSCETEDNTCRINGVPGGSYRVAFEPVEGEAPPPRTAMIPPSGTVTLVLSAPTDR